MIFRPKLKMCNVCNGQVRIKIIRGYEKRICSTCGRIHYVEVI